MLQYVEPLRRLGVTVRAHPPRINKYTSLPQRWARRPLVAPAARSGLRLAKLAVRTPTVVRSWSCDATWLDREVLPGRLTLEPLLGRPLVFDVDDAIWMLSDGNARAAREIADRAACVVAGNDFLADWFSSRARAVECIPTAVDTDRFRPAEPPTAKTGGDFVVGWTGSRSTSRYLQQIEPMLARFFGEAPDARLLVVSDVLPELRHVPPERVEFVPWSPASEAEALRGIDVGLMPLPDSDWARGKCSLKMLQYMACGVPAVVSAVGMNRQVLAMGDVAVGVSRSEEWVGALLSLREEVDRRQVLGRSGRDLVERCFSVEVIAPRLASVFHKFR